MPRTTLPQLRSGFSFSPPPPAFPHFHWEHRFATSPALGERDDLATHPRLGRQPPRATHFAPDREFSLSLRPALHEQQAVGRPSLSSTAAIRFIRSPLGRTRQPLLHAVHVSAALASAATSSRWSSPGATRTAGTRTTTSSWSTTRPSTPQPSPACTPTFTRG